MDSSGRVFIICGSCGARLFSDRLKCSECGGSVAETAEKMLDDLMAGIEPPKVSDADLAFQAEQEKRRRREQREANRRRRGKTKGRWL